MNRLNHATSLLNLFHIWKEGSIKPQPYSGGDSALPKGTEVTFCFRLPRIFLGEILILFPEDLEPDGEGQIVRWADYEDACYGSDDPTLDPNDFMETEYWVFHEVPLKGCEVYRLCSVPHTPDEWDLEDPELCLAFDPEWFYSEEGQEELQTFLDWVNSLPRYKED